LILDAHTHLGGVRSGGEGLRGWVYVSVGDLLNYMDTCGISKAVVLPIEKVPGIGEDLWLTERVLEACGEHPGRLIPFCTVNPSVEDVEVRIKTYVEKGCRGFGEHRVPIPVDHPANVSIYTACEAQGIPVLLEISGAYNYGFESFMKIVSAFPRLVFIAHGPGWWREVSAEPDRSMNYPSGPVKPGGLVEKLLSDRENVYADLSATSGYNALSRDHGFTEGFVERFSHKLIFGTDFPCIDREGLQYGPDRRHLSLLQGLRVTSVALRRILCENISAVLGLT